MRVTFQRRSARQRELVDGVFAAYTQWRGECSAVRNAYRAWAGASPADKRTAFDGYNAALDREEHAACRYARLMGRAGQLPETGLTHQLTQIHMSLRGQ
jgi:hypothetical protein